MNFLSSVILKIRYCARAIGEVGRGEMLMRAGVACGAPACCCCQRPCQYPSAFAPLAHHPTSLLRCAHCQPRAPEQASAWRRLRANSPVKKKKTRGAILHLVSRADLHLLELAQALRLHLHTGRLRGRGGVRNQVVRRARPGPEICARSWVRGGSGAAHHDSHAMGAYHTVTPPRLPPAPRSRVDVKHGTL